MSEDPHDAGWAAELERLTADARYARERRALYRARSLTGRDVSPSRMRELEHTAERTADRLAAARVRHAGEG